jgi:DNA primase
MDVIAAHQHGYTNTVASMGTALTGQQVSQLKPLAKNFVLALDPDAAGQEATLRSLESSWRVFEHRAERDRHRSIGSLYQREMLTLKIAALPAGRDPDTVIRENPKEWEQLTGEAVPLMDYLIPAVASRFDLTVAHGKAQVAEVLGPMIQSMDSLDQDHYLRKLAMELDVSEQALKASIGGVTARGRGSRQRGSRPEVVASPLSRDPEDSLEDYTLALLLHGPALKERAHDVDPEHFHKIEDREVFTSWLGCSTIDDLRDSLDESLREHLTYLTQTRLVLSDYDQSEAALRQCLQRLERRHLQELQEALLTSEDVSVPPPREMEAPIANVNARLKENFSQRVR